MLPSSAAPFCLFWLPWCVSCVSELRMLLAGAVSKSIQHACYVSRTLMGLQLREEGKERKSRPWSSCMDKEGGPWNPTLTWGPSSYDGCWRRQSTGFLQECIPCWTALLPHTCGTERAHWVLGGVHKVGRERKQVVGEVGGEDVRVDLIKIRYIHVSTSQMID